MGKLTCCDLGFVRRNKRILYMNLTQQKSTTRV